MFGGRTLAEFQEDCRRLREGRDRVNNARTSAEARLQSRAGEGESALAQLQREAREAEARQREMFGGRTLAEFQEDCRRLREGRDRDI